MNILVVFAFTVAIALGAPVEDEDTRINGENGWYVPQIDGSFEWISKEDAAKQMHDMLLKDRASTVVEFYLYTKSNPTTPTKITASASSIKGSKFNAAHPTRFVIHGWSNSYTDEVNTYVRNAWLSKGDYNIIVVDWSSRAQSLNYASSVMYVPAVGKLVAEFIDYLHNDFQLSFGSLTVIGHSLGAHVAGFTGKNVRRGQINTIIGLDPALPLYSYDSPTQRLSLNDAYYVESIQTNGGTLGFLKPIGKGAFYANGGQSQPGCGIDLTGSCAHSRSYMYYSEAVTKNDFPTMKCSDYEKAVSKSCGSTYSSVRMGALTNTYSAAGEFYVPVNKNSPYGMG